MFFFKKLFLITTTYIQHNMKIEYSLLCILINSIQKKKKKRIIATQMSTLVWPWNESQLLPGPRSAWVFSGTLPLDTCWSLSLGAVSTYKESDLIGVYSAVNKSGCSNLNKSTCINITNIPLEGKMFWFLSLLSALTAMLRYLSLLILRS